MCVLPMAAIALGCMRATAEIPPAGSGSGGSKGGLAMLFEMVLGGLVGTSPHMISASVMALARLLHQFANELGGAPMPSISKSSPEAVISAVRLCVICLLAEHSM